MKRKYENGNEITMREGEKKDTKKMRKKELSSKRARKNIQMTRGHTTRKLNENINKINYIKLRMKYREIMFFEWRNILHLAFPLDIYLYI